MAEIYRARTRPPIAEEAEWVALKMMRSSLEQEALRSRLFEREARIASLIHHANVVPVFEYGHELGRAYLAMEYVLGRDLSHLLLDQRDELEPFPVELALYIGFCAASGLGHAHRLTDEAGRPLGIVHRDVSPGNIMVGYDGTVKVLDFGVARMNETHGTRTQTGTLRGKFAYMSPEQTRGEHLDARSDVFSLGTVLYELLTGHNCFRAENPIATLDRVQNLRPLPPSQVGDHISKDVDRLLARCLAKEQGKRFADCEALKNALGEFLADILDEGRARLVEHFGNRFDWARHEEQAELEREAEEVALLEVVDFVQAGSDGRLDAPRVVVPQEEEASEVEIEKLNHRTIDATDLARPVFDVEAPRAVPSAPKTGDTKPAELFDGDIGAGRSVDASSLLDQRMPRRETRAAMSILREPRRRSVPPPSTSMPPQLPSTSPAFAVALEFGETLSTVMVPVHDARPDRGAWRARHPALTALVVRHPIVATMLGGLVLTCAVFAVWGLLARRTSAPISTPSSKSVPSATSNPSPEPSGRTRRLEPIRIAADEEPRAARH